MSPWSVCEISAQLDLPRSTVSDIVKLKCPEQQQLNHEVVNWQTHRAGPIKPDHLTITHCTLLNCIWKLHQHMNSDPRASWNGFLWLSSISWSEARNNWLQRSGNVMNSASLSGSLMDSLHYLPEWILPTLKANWIMVWGCLSGHQILQDISMKRLPEILMAVLNNVCGSTRHADAQPSQECAPSSWQKPRQCIEHLVDFQSKTPDTTHNTQSELTLKKLF